MHRIASAAAAIVLASAIVGDQRVHTAAPPVTSSSAAEDLAKRVLIRRDTFGVPHILAEDDEAAAFGLGYANAEDHAAELGRRYLLARGDGARWFGRRVVENDFAMKRLGNLEGARLALAQSGEGYRRWMRGFVTGINTYVAEHRSELPAWMPVVTEADILAHSHRDAVMAALRPPRGRRQEASSEVAQGPAPAERDTIVPLVDLDSGPGSNALALSGTRTESGHPILLANPHLRWSATYWEAHVTVPGQINFYGSTTLGLAVLRAGFGERIGYAQTNNAPDLVDHYTVPLDAHNPDHYRFNGRTQPFQQQTVTVDVLEPDGRLQPATRTFQSTEFGPVVERTATHAIVARSEALNAWRFHEGFYELLRARDLASFQEIMSRQLIPQSNFTYADVDGNIQYLWNARLPRRPRAEADYTSPVPGDDDSYFFQGVHPLSELPRVLNPPSGYVQNANNAPWFATVRDRLDPTRYPPYTERRELALRPQMALIELEKRDRFSVDDVRRLKFNNRVLLADRVLPDLFAAGEAAASPSADLRQGLVVLRSWDRQVAAASRGAVLFITFWNLYDGGRPRPAASPPLSTPGASAARSDDRGGASPFAIPWDEARPIDTPAGLADPNAALAALEKAVATVRERHGSPDVAWGDVNRFQFGDFDLPGDGAPGGYGLYRVLSFDDVPQGHGKAVAGRPGAGAPIAGTGDGWVLLMHFTQPIKATGVLAYGQTSNPASPHNRDQIGLFARHELRPIWFSETDIRANLEREYRPGVPPSTDVRRVDTYVDSDPGVRIFVREVASASLRARRTPILLVHGGGPGGLASFDLGVPGYSLASDLAREGHPVYVMNVRGWEHSTRPVSLDQPAAANAPAVTFEEAGRDIGAVIDWIRRRRGGAKVAVLGWASGGHWSGAYASRKAVGISHLILLNTLYGVEGPWPLADSCSDMQAMGAYRLADGGRLMARWDQAIPADARRSWRESAVADAFVERVLLLDPTSESRQPYSARVPLGYLSESCAMVSAARCGTRLPSKCPRSCYEASTISGRARKMWRRCATHSAGGRAPGSSRSPTPPTISFSTDRNTAGASLSKRRCSS